MSLGPVPGSDHEGRMATIVDLDVDKGLEGDLRSPSRGLEPWGYGKRFEASFVTRK
jgi:hypothetical protein